MEGWANGSKLGGLQRGCPHLSFGAEECGLEAVQLRSRKLHDAAFDGADGAAKEAVRQRCGGSSGGYGGSNAYGATTAKPRYFGSSGYGGGANAYGLPPLSRLTWGQRRRLECLRRSLH